MERERVYKSVVFSLGSPLEPLRRAFFKKKISCLDSISRPIKPESLRVGPRHWSLLKGPQVTNVQPEYRNTPGHEFGLADTDGGLLASFLFKIGANDSPTVNSKLRASL
jgi:hypothetical protein